MSIKEMLSLLQRHPVGRASIWFDNWGVMGLGLKTGGRGSGFENWGVVGPKSSTKGGA